LRYAPWPVFVIPRMGDTSIIMRRPLL